VITRAIGAPDDDGELDKAIGPAKPGDIFLLCSDGLTKVLDDTTIAQLMVAPDPAQALIQAALAGDARDNVTAVVVCVPEDAR
jgi:serine/threonine protein phosphatase PrpC